jgi:uncharacterized protein (TIGR00369 family)
VSRAGRPHAVGAGSIDPAVTGGRVPANCELTLGMTCVERSEPGKAVWAMPADEHLANPAGMVQGGLLAALAVGAMSTVLTDVRGSAASAVSSELKISFIKGAPIGETLTCTACVIGGGRRAAFLEAEITDSSQGLVAKASSTYILGRGD